MKKRFLEKPISAFLREAGHGVAENELCHKRGFSETLFRAARDERESASVQTVGYPDGQRS